MEPAIAHVPDLDPAIRLPYPPMEARAVEALPPGVVWVLEPKRVDEPLIQPAERLAAAWVRRAG